MTKCHELWRLICSWTHYCNYPFYLLTLSRSLAFNVISYFACVSNRVLRHTRQVGYAARDNNVQRGQSSLISDIQRHRLFHLFVLSRCAGDGGGRAYTRIIARVFSGRQWTSKRINGLSFKRMIATLPRSLLNSWCPFVLRALSGGCIFINSIPHSLIVLPFQPTFSFSLKFDVSRYAAYKWSRVNWYVVLERTAGQ